MFCPKCGKENIRGAKFCVECGAPLTAAGNSGAGTPAKKSHPRARWYGRFWKNTFRYGGTAERQEYFVPVMFTILIMAVELPLLLLASVTDLLIVDVFVFLLALYLTVSMVPLISLTVRRLRSVGRSGMWAGLILAVGIGTVILMWMCGTADFSSSEAEESYDPSVNVQEEVYGPPEWFEDEVEPDESYEASENMEECVYGPPEWFEDEADQ